MKAIVHILSKQLVQQFYIANTGFFLFMFFFFFGIVHPGELLSYHTSLVSGMLASPVFLAAVMLGWLLYNFKFILFCTSLIHAPGSVYLHVLKTLSTATQLRLYTLVSTAIYLPVLVYASFVISIATGKSMIGIAATLIIYQLFNLLAAATCIYTAINSNKPSYFQNLFAKISRIFRLHTGYYSFLTSHFLHSRKMAFISIKIFSLLLLAVSFVRNGDNFDADLFSIFFQLILIAHAVLVFYAVEFNETLLQNNRNLPISTSKTLSMYGLTWLITLLPETVFIFINNHGNLPLTHIGLLSLTAIATLLLYTSLAYACSLNMDQYMLFIFVCFIMIFFIQKTGLYLLTLTAILLAATSIFKAHYFSFQRE